MDTIKVKRKIETVQPIEKVEAMHVWKKIPVMTAYQRGSVVIIEPNYSTSCDWSVEEIRAWANALLELADQTENS